jgi:phosphatidylserine/phosphatidylglycerophosphate/cardiolipin synthase-like enzyme
MLALLEGPDKLDVFAAALESGELHLESTASALQAKLGLPQARLRAYRDALIAAPNVDSLIVALRTSAQTANRLAVNEPQVEVAWTYPGTSRPGIRTTGGVAKEIIDASRTTLLVVGYSVTTDSKRAGLAAQTLKAIASAAMRHVSVTAVLHREANRNAFLSEWHAGASPPSIFTWPFAEDEKASIHAKLLVADRNVALVTSANLTLHGFEKNIEMGVRVTSRPAAEIHDRIFELIATRDLVPWPG